VGVKQKGCSGNSYNLEFTDKKGKFDEIVQQDGKSVMIKWESAVYDEYLSNAKI
jgi:Fe-S cluster assembly iron-binding protein IscA